MAVRTAAAQALDTSINTMLSDLDSYLALAGQSGEPVNAVADIFWGTLISKLATRARMRPLIFSNPRDIARPSDEQGQTSERLRGREPDAGPGMGEVLYGSPLGDRRSSRARAGDEGLIYRDGPAPWSRAFLLRTFYGHKIDVLPEYQISH